MAQSDVEFSISAVDQASDILSQITEKVSVFVSSTKSNMDKLLADDSTVQGYKKQIDVLATSIKDLKNAFSTIKPLQLQQEVVDGYAISLAELDQQLNILNDEQDSTRASFRSVQQMVTSLDADIDQLNNSLKELSDTEKSLNDKQKQITSVANLSSQIDELVSNQNKLKSSLADAVQKQQNTTAAVDATSAAIGRYKAAIKEAYSVQARKTTFNSDIEKQKEYVSSLRVELQKLVDQQKVNKQEDKAASKEVDSLSKAIDNLDTKITKLSGDKFNLTSNLGIDNTVTAVEKAEKELSAALNDATESVKIQKQELKLAQDTKKQLTSIVKQLGTEEQKLATSISSLTSKQSTLNTKNQEGVNKLRDLESAATSAGVDINNLVGEQVRLATAIEKGNLSLASGRSELNEYSVAVKRAAASQRSIVKPLKDSSDLMSIFGDTSRKSMSIMQRVRGELLSTATSLFGIYGAYNQIVKASQAYIDKQTTISRLAIVLGDDTQKLGDQLTYVEGVAKRLALPIGVLRDQYSNLFLAMSQQGQSVENIRTVFEGISVAARTSNMSTEDVAGTFRALIQVMGKGKVMAEELTQQLGDRFPVATALMAKSMGITTAELFKMMEQGQVTSDRLIGFAKLIGKEYSGALPKSLDTFRAKLILLQNAITLNRENFGESFTKQLEPLIERLTTLANNGEIEKGLEKLGTGVSKVAGGLVTLAENLDVVIPLLEGFLAFTGLKLLFEFSNSITRVTTLVGTLSKQTGGLAGAFSKLSAVAGSAGLLVTMYDIGKAIGNLLNKIPGFTTGMSHLVEWFLIATETAKLFFTNILQPWKIPESANEYIAKIKELRTHFAQQREDLKAAEGDWENLGKATEEAAKKSKEASRDFMYGKLADGAKYAKAEYYLFTEAEKDVKDELDNITNAAKEQEKALKGLGEKLNAIDPNSESGFKDLTSLLKEAGYDFENLGVETDKFLGKLDIDKTAAFVKNLDGLRASGEISAEVFELLATKVQSMSREKLGKLFESLGVSVDDVLGKVDPAAKGMIKNLDDIRTTMLNAGAGATEFEKFMMQAIGKTDTAEGLIILDQWFNKVKNSSGLSAEGIAAVSRALQEQRQVVKESAEGYQSVSEALRKLGIEAPNDLKKVADENERAFQALIKLKAEPEQIRKGFIEYATSAVKANNGVASSTLQAQANVLGYSAVVSQLTKKAKEYNDTIDEQHTLSEGVNELASLSLQLKEQQLNRDLAVAKAEGNLNGIRNATIALANLEIEKTKLKVKAKQEEIKLLVLEAKLKRLSVADDGKVTQEEKLQLQISDQKIKIMEAELALLKDSVKTTSIEAQSKIESINANNAEAESINKVVEAKKSLNSIGFESGAGLGNKDIDGQIESLSRLEQAAKEFRAVQERLKQESKNTDLTVKPNQYFDAADMNKQLENIFAQVKPPKITPEVGLAEENKVSLVQEVLALFSGLTIPVKLVPDMSLINTQELKTGGRL